MKTVLNHGDAKGCCFATACLCTAKYILALESKGDTHSLDGSRLVILFVRDVSHDVFVQVLQVAKAQSNGQPGGNPSCCIWSGSAANSQGETQRGVRHCLKQTTALLITE